MAAIPKTKKAKKDKKKPKEERKNYRTATIFTQKEMDNAREFAQMEIDFQGGNTDDKEVDGKTPSQQFADTLLDYVPDLES